MIGVWFRIFYDEHELLRRYPVLWSCNLHRLPKRLVRSYVAVAIGAVLVWFRLPLGFSEGIVVGACGVLAAILSAGIIADYSGIPNDEYVPTPWTVHLLAFLARFGALMAVMLAPLLLGELMLMKNATVPTQSVVAAMNDFNVGVAACCRIQAERETCAPRWRLPAPDRTERQLREAELALFTTDEVRERVAACGSAARCLAVLIGRLDSAVVEMLSFSRLQPLRINQPEAIRSEMDDTGTASVGGDATKICARATTNFTAAKIVASSLLRARGLATDGSRPIPAALYVDAFLWSAWLAFLVGIGLLGSAGAAAGMIYGFPVLVSMALMMVGGLISVVVPLPLLELPEPQQSLEEWWPLLQWFPVAYFGVLGTGYLFAVVRLVRRPLNEDRAASLAYVLGYPLSLLVLVFFLDVSGTTLPGLVSSRVMLINAVILVVYGTGFSYLRREGERMRALPRKAGPVSDQGRRRPRDKRRFGR